MSKIETLGILDEIEALVSDKLQVVSYKWLSRNFLISSNAAKRLLQEFVEKHESGLEVVYALSGWLKKDPHSYHIRLVRGPKLAEAREEFDGNCSVQVYSIQACIPKDLAALWNAEFVQAEELFKEPSGLDNCLRDNRFCGVSNSFVKRNLEGLSVSTVSQQPKSEAVPGPSKSTSKHQNTTAVKNVKSESNGIGIQDQATKPPVDKQTVPPLLVNKKKGQNDKIPSGTGGSLANLWSRASGNSKPSCAAAENNNLDSNPTVGAEAQICDREAAEGGSSDDDDQDVNFKRASSGEGSRKRRVVFDLSDEEEFEDAVNLASPDPPKGKLCVDLKQITETSVSENNLNHEKQQEHRPNVKEEKATNIQSNKPSLKDSSVVSKGTSSKIYSSENIHSCNPENDATKKDKVTNAAPNSPKRRKVLKTRIDERGREVTEVVWEGEETETKKADSNLAKKADSNLTKKADSNTLTNAVNRQPAVKKSPAAGSTAPSNATIKAGNKKGNVKDPKQGNIMSFFKKV